MSAVPLRLPAHPEPSPRGPRGRGCRRSGEGSMELATLCLVSDDRTLD